MEWTPNSEGLKELLDLFKESQGSNNTKHRQIFEVKT